MQQLFQVALILCASATAALADRYTDRMPTDAAPDRVLAYPKGAYGKAVADVDPTIAHAPNAAFYFDLSLGEARRGLKRLDLTAIATAKGFARVSADIATLRRQVRKLYAQSKFEEAIPIAKRYVALAKREYGDNHIKYANAIEILAALYSRRGRYKKAEPLFQRSLAIKEKALGPDDPNVGTTLNNLALLYKYQDRYREAEPLFQRSLAIKEKALGPDDPGVATTLDNLASLYKRQDRYREAESLFQRSLEIKEKALGPDDPNVGTTLNNLASLYKRQDRYLEAEPLFQRSLAIKEKTLGPDHPKVATTLANLASLYVGQRRYRQAKSLFQRSLAIYRAALGPDHPRVATILSNLGVLALKQNNWAQTANFWQQCADILIRRAQISVDDASQALSGEQKSETERLSYQFWLLVKVAHRLAKQRGDANMRLKDEMFQMAQWAHNSRAAAALAQMAARQAKGSGPLAKLVRERQDLIGQWHKRDAIRTTAFYQPSDKRNKQSEEANARRLVQIEGRIAAINDLLKKDHFSNYAALEHPPPLSVEEVQAQLHDGEALLLFLDTLQLEHMPEETFIWVVTKTTSHWARSRLGTKSLKKSLANLRKTLGVAGTVRAMQPRKHTQHGRAMHFLRQAHELYKSLLGPVAEDLKAAKHLILVPSGPLTGLSWQLLVTEPPDPKLMGLEAYRKASWLIRSHAVSVLPSVFSLKALREHPHLARAAAPFIAFADPQLTGRFAADKAAWAHQTCPKSDTEVASLQIAARNKPDDTHESVRSVADFFHRGGAANIASVRQLRPLPETADEVCSVARALGASQDTIYLGAKATEATVRELSATGRLASSRVVHFATHGLVSGELKNNAEPALVLTPPEAEANDNIDPNNDGLLTASEVTELKLNADWVVLSACNTAAAGGGDAEPLSGLARAFFYAGARALLVSHWKVNTHAAVALVTATFENLKSTPHIGRAEALRQAMLSLINGSSKYAAHPAYWAPFVVIGDGGAQ